jgi:branched-chain amino acid transport system ATP-binding protein
MSSRHISGNELELSMLKIRNLCVRHNEIEAVKGVSLHATRGEIVTLIGSNGAGKTSLLESIIGLNKNISGEILFENSDIADKSPGDIVSAGIALVPEGRQIFSSMSVEDNLYLGAYSRFKYEKKQSIVFDEVYELFPVLKQRCRQMSASSKCWPSGGL